MYWYILRWKRTFDFKGRSRRTEYWMSFLVDLFISFFLGFISISMGMGGLMPQVYYVVIIIPILGATVRRLHDSGRSGWWLLLLGFPVVSELVALNPDMAVSLLGIILSISSFIACITLFIFMLQDGQVGENNYGKNPKTLEDLGEL
ncbi:MAG: DUF805 domain-containing protein [Clostridium sp.]